MDQNESLFFSETAKEMHKHIFEIVEYPQYYSNLFDSPNSIIYCCSDASSDMGTFSSIMPFPEIIVHHYVSAKFKATFGCFPEINRFYCTIDNKIFLWSIGNKEPEQKEESAAVICCACLCGVDPIFQFDHPELRYTLVVATPKYITIYKVNGNQVNFNDSFVIPIKFAPSCIAAGPDGQIFVGADSGRIFLIKYDNVSEFKATSIAYSYSLVDWTYGIFPRLLNKLVGYSSLSITQIVFNLTYSYIAAIDEKLHLRFFNYEVNSNSCTVLSFEDPENNEVVSVCSVPSEDEESQPQFIAFCKDGTRLLIRKKYGNGLVFHIVNKKSAPREFGNDPKKDSKKESSNYPTTNPNQDELICAQSFMGLTVMVGKKRAYMLRGERYSEDGQMSVCEFVSTQNLPGTGLSLGVTNLDPIWIDPLIWQHHREPPIIYISTSAGGYKYQFAPPSDQLLRLVNISHGFENQKITEYLGNSCTDYEPVTNAILSSFHQPECDNYLIYMITRYSLEKSDKQYQNLGKLYNNSIFAPSKILSGIVMRIVRILLPFWNSKLFITYVSKKNAYKKRVDPVFSTISPILTKNLDHTKQWMNKYLDYLQSNTEIIVSKTSTLFIYEKKIIHKLSTFVDIIIQYLTFMSLLSQQKKSLITEILQEIKKDKDMQESFKFLTEKKFGECLLNFEFFASSMCCISKIIFTRIEPSTELDEFGQQLTELCPYLSLSLNAEFQVLESINRLAAIVASGLPITEKQQNLPFVVNGLIEYPQYITVGTLNQVVSKLVSEFNDFKFSILIIEAKLKSLDPSNRAVQFYRMKLEGDPTTTFDGENEKVFYEVSDFLYLPIRIILNEPKGIDHLMESSFQIIHVYVFDYYYHNEPEKLLTLNSPYIIEFLTKYMPDFLWKYYLIRQDKKKMYKEIIKRFSIKGESIDEDDISYTELELNEAAQMLQVALHYARNCNVPVDEINEIIKAIDKVNSRKGRSLRKIKILGEKDLEKIKQKFIEIDTDKNGVLDAQELNNVFHDLAYVKKIFRTFGLNPQKDSISFENYCTFVETEKLEKAFNDIAEDDKALGKEKLKIYYEKIGASENDLEMSLDDYIATYDSNHDGKLTFQEATEFRFDRS